ncbi:MAG: PstS family phosphate ABC transporter substrate-binding protein [Microcystis sp. M54BS1]|uniref:PstS family phosphate ABC transporter substrate-binding protein n=1 Tax=unclassified Microcystis TaxID=2643300 RepID=UPI00257D40BE|nr:MULTISPECIES: PstS family phosphate ABC transporter substrate-binding protein [unclassified Microcystis]MCA2540312.1 PstS family phosphate ABC transporter substrate-binding protein [Microcystis sp. M54BS1]MCA2597443.1 PstS family phosphate ABC transporter substrate-binding protein [Microcystis sp. M38BS1]MCA2611910.1 PstS family phosphate ABC transporter substrate-binding protein [Microcystis sp. M27BS1]MCA2504893.1 PstS family phosphate ABC transporter substrate-binding protein [Microcystis
MSQKNEILPLLLTVMVTSALLGGIAWWLLNKTFPNLNDRSNSSSSNNQISETLGAVKNVPEGLFNYGGSTTWAPIRKEVDFIIQQVWPKFRLVYTDPTAGTPGTGSGIRMLIENQLAFSQASRSLKDEEIQRAQQRGLTLKEVPVAIDGIAIAVHPDLPVSGLTITQLKDIYTGKIRNWRQVGGPNLAIIPYSRRKEDGGTVEFFIDQVLEKADFGDNIQYVYSTTPALRKVSQNPGGIYYASAPEVVPQCGIKTLPLGKSENKLVAPYQEPSIPSFQCPQKRNQLNELAFQKGEYPITRRLFVIIKQNGQLDEQAGEAYANLLLTDQGQELIKKAGFVPLR